MRIVKFVLMFLILTDLASAPASASSISGKVKFLLSRINDGLQYVEIDGARTPTKPACASPSDYFMIRDEKSDAGKAQFAMLMAAYLADRQVTVEGAGTCTRWSDGEDINSVMYAR